MSYQKLMLKKDQDRRLLAGHLWIYSNEVNTTLTPLSQFRAGELVEITASNQKPLGIGYINPNTLLCARLLTRDVKENIDGDFFRRRLQRALTLRDQLFSHPYYRWVFSESDGLPGLIIDRYNDVVVIQINTAGLDQLKPLILAAVQSLVKTKTILWRNDSSYRKTEGLEAESSIAAGEEINEHRLHENGCDFIAPLLLGQKTGWFFDHRANRALIAQYARGKTVLDLFCYLGAFTLPIAKAGATRVTAIDSSKTAIDYLQKNAELNQVADRVEAIATDVFDYLTKAAAEGKRFDILVLDPPAFIKKKKEHPQGLRAYEKINQQALGLLNPGGMLLSASCSMHLSAEELLDVMRRASLKAGRALRILQPLHQGMDHPVHPSIPETNYLKGYLAIVD